MSSTSSFLRQARRSRETHIHFDTPVGVCQSLVIDTPSSKVSFNSITPLLLEVHATEP